MAPRPATEDGITKLNWSQTVKQVLAALRSCGTLACAPYVFIFLAGGFLTPVYLLWRLL